MYQISNKQVEIPAARIVYLLAERIVIRLDTRTNCCGYTGWNEVYKNQNNKLKLYHSQRRKLFPRTQLGQRPP